MAKFKYLDLDVAAWVADTRHLNATLRGVYMDTLVLAWMSEKCRLPYDLKTLARLLNYRFNEIKALERVISEFWRVDRYGKWLHQKRLDKEHMASLQRWQQGFDNAKARWNKGKKASRNASTVTGTVLDSPSGYSNTVPSRMRARAPLKATRDAPRDEEKINPYPVKGPTAEERAKEWADYCAKMKAEEERNAATKH